MNICYYYNDSPPSQPGPVSRLDEGRNHPIGHWGREVQLGRRILGHGEIGEIEGGSRHLLSCQHKVSELATGGWGGVDAVWAEATGVSVPSATPPTDGAPAATASNLLNSADGQISPVSYCSVSLLALAAVRIPDQWLLLIGYGQCFTTRLFWQK